MIKPFKEHFDNCRLFLFNKHMPINDENELLEDFRQTCRRHGLRVTPQRVLIYRELIKSEDHPSAEVLYERIGEDCPDISFDTVYRTLAAFDEMGLIDRVDGFGTSMRFDPNIGWHHHFKCRQCGLIMDFESDSYKRAAIPKDITQNCEVLKLQVILEGFCKKCRK